MFHQSDQFHVSGRWNAGVPVALFFPQDFTLGFPPPPFIFLICSSFPGRIWLLDAICRITWRISRIQALWRTHGRGSDPSVSPCCHPVSLSRDGHALALSEEDKVNPATGCNGVSGSFGNRGAVWNRDLISTAR